MTHTYVDNCIGGDVGQPFEKNGTEGGHFCGFTMDVEEKLGWIDGNGMGRKNVAGKE